MSKKILVFRFSALGDVAMVSAVLKQFAQVHPKVELIMVSRKKFEALFDEIPNLKFIGIDLEKDYKGINGLWKLSRLLKKEQPTHIADLHNVLRTKILRFFLFPLKDSSLDKGRKEKKLLTKKSKKTLKSLTPMHERYAMVFNEIGFSFTLKQSSLVLNSMKNGIGFAPFANYKEKMLPLEKSKSIVLKLAKNGEKVCLFGGSPKEIEILKKWENLHPNIINTSGIYSMKEELRLIKDLKCMISMDSANMHLASLVGTRVVSIWGATHPFAGFLGLGQRKEDCIQIQDLECRPCSVFGNKPCFRNDLACLNRIDEDAVIEKVYDAI